MTYMRALMASSQTQGAVDVSGFTAVAIYKSKPHCCCEAKKNTSVARYMEVYV